MAPPSRTPAHVAIIMDGNGRWATSRGLPRIQGHREGARSVDEIVRASRELGVRVLTLYSFSTENWSRPPDEVSGLMELLREYVGERKGELLGNGIRLRAIGQLDRLPLSVRALLDAVCRATDRSGAVMTLNLALSYGGRAEIVEAVRSLARRVRRGELDPERIDESLFASQLQTAGLGDPDLLIRTSGEMRLSNFLLWQIAYTELYVTPALWPDFRKPQLIEAFEDYSRRERRFGRVR